MPDEGEPLLLLLSLLHDGVLPLPDGGEVPALMGEYTPLLEGSATITSGR